MAADNYSKGYNGLPRNDTKLDPAYKARQANANYDDSRQWDSAALGLSDRKPGVPLYNSDEPKVALEEPQLKRFHQAMKQRGVTHREPRDVIWKNCWSLYNNEFDFSQKVWWQHKTPLPKVRVSVDRAVALFRKTLLKMNPFYGLKAESKVGRMKGRYTMLLDDYYFDQAKVVNELVLGFKVGLITSTAINKIWWQRTRDFKPEIYSELHDSPTYEFGIQTGNRTETLRKSRLQEYYKGTLGFACVNPSNLWVIPGTRNRTVIERSECTLNEIESLVKDAKHPEGIYEQEAVERLRDKCSNPSSSDDYENPNSNNESRVDADQYLRTVCLEHYWGDIYDTSGNLVMCDASYTFAGFNSGDDILIRKPRSNPFFHKNPPYVIGSPYLVPFSTYNRGMIEDVADIAESIVEMANLIADGALYDALKAFAIDVDQLDDPAEAKSGMYPGKTFLFKSSNSPAPNAQVVQTVSTGRIPAEANNMIGLYEKYYQEGSYINEWVGGTGSKTDRTLGEVQIKTSSALEGLDESARNLEVSYIEPSILMATQVIYQFHDDYMIPRLMENYPQVSMLLQDLTPAERYSTMVGGFTFEVKGISIMLDRAARIGEFKEILQLLSYLPGFIEQINPIAALEEILSPIGWDPNKLLLNPSAGAGMVPMPGAQPSPQAVPPGLPAPNGPGAQGQPQMAPGGQRMSAMNQANARDGARFGGAQNNPNAAAMMNPEIIKRMILQRLTAMRGRPGMMGQPQL